MSLQRLGLPGHYVSLLITLLAKSSWKLGHMPYSLDTCMLAYT